MQPVRSRPLVLLVEGSPASRSRLSQHLMDEGFDLLAVENGEAALCALQANRPDVVVLDPGAPCVQQTGLRRLLRQPREGRAPALLALVESVFEGERYCLGDDVTADFILRPAQPAEVALRVRLLLRHRATVQQLARDLDRQVELGIALSSERDLSSLLDRLVLEARALTHADAGTLYTVDRREEVLRFRILHNDTLDVRRVSDSPTDSLLPPVPIAPENVSGYVALTGETICVDDVRRADRFDFSGPRRYDQLTGYVSISMLVVPIRDHEGVVIGVLQLINARHPRTGRVVPFRSRSVQRIQSLASQAGIALTNNALIQELENLSEGLLQVMASAVDEKSPSTAGHVRRVTALALELARVLGEQGHPGFDGSPEDMDELRVAGMLHDIGKIVIPEHLTEKATKLQAVHDRIAEIRARFLVAQREAEHPLRPCACSLEEAEREAAARRVAHLAEDLLFLERLNCGGERLDAEDEARLRRIAGETYRGPDGRPHPLLTPEEYRNLAIPRGTLLPEELERVRSHAAVTQRLLAQIPFSRRLRNVAQIAGDHHEALDGSGYPNRKRGDEISIQARILAIADVYDALTAADRAYKSAYPPEEAHRIMREEVRIGRLDGALVDLFFTCDCPGRAAGVNLLPAPEPLPWSIEEPADEAKPRRRKGSARAR